MDMALAALFKTTEDQQAARRFLSGAEWAAQG
jgi:hypothetical protein